MTDDVSKFEDTIFALASGPGRAGISVIRISGPQALEAVAAFLRGGAASLPCPRKASVRHLFDLQSGALLDEALVLVFRGPGSFTGEDLAELHVHGSPAVVRSVLGALSGLRGCRMAAPGEFTRRAFENGRIDLTEAEAIGDLIHAETQAQQQQALSQMGGALRDLYEGWAGRLTHLLAYIEADLDFSDQDLPEDALQPLLGNVHALMEEIGAHLDDGRRGERLRDGVRVVLLGAPNAGKSSLLNALAQRDVAIVSDLAGTTRDLLEVHLDLGGYPVIVTDTAGLRPVDLLEFAGHGEIERQGIARALKAAEAADLRVFVFDAQGWPELDADTRALVRDAAEGDLVLLNKADLCGAMFDNGPGGPGQSLSVDGRPALPLSVRSQSGFSAFLEILESRVKDMAGLREAPALSRQRHREALSSCVAALARALTAPLPELVAEDLRLAVRALGRITGRVDVEDLLERIFSDFCIGK